MKRYIHGSAAAEWRNRIGQRALTYILSSGISGMDPDPDDINDNEQAEIAAAMELAARWIEDPSLIDAE